MSVARSTKRLYSVITVTPILLLASRQRLYHLMVCLASQVASDGAKAGPRHTDPISHTCLCLDRWDLCVAEVSGFLEQERLDFDTRYHRASPYLLRSKIGASRESHRLMRLIFFRPYKVVCSCPPFLLKSSQTQIWLALLCISPKPKQ